MFGLNFKWALGHWVLLYIFLRLRLCILPKFRNSCDDLHRCDRKTCRCVLQTDQILYMLDVAFHSVSSTRSFHKVVIGCQSCWLHPLTVTAGTSMGVLVQVVSCHHLHNQPLSEQLVLDPKPHLSLTRPLFVFVCVCYVCVCESR